MIEEALLNTARSTSILLPAGGAFLLLSCALSVLLADLPNFFHIRQASFATADTNLIETASECS